MVNFDALRNEKNLKKLEYTNSHQDALKYILPIQGIDLQNDNNIKIGKIEFLNLDGIEKYITKEKRPLLKNYFNVNSFAVVSTNILPKDRRHEFVLQYLKEVIGALHLFTFKKYGLDKERKIVITDNSTPEIEEGLVKRILICEDDIYDWQTNYDLMLTPKEIEEIDLSPWNDFFYIPISKRNEFQKIKGKTLEILYYCVNDIHAISRMQKLFILLNFTLRKDNGDFNRNYLQKYYGIIIDRILKVSPFEKFGKDFELLYNNARNNIQHGLIDCDSEFSVVKTEDYYNLKTIVLYSIIYLFENKDFCCVKTMQEVIDYLDNFLKIEIEKIKNTN